VIGDYCAKELHVEGFGQTFLTSVDAHRIASDLGIPFMGLSYKAGGSSASKGNRLIILDSGAAVDVCCDRTYLIPGIERPCHRRIAGVGGVHIVTSEADFRIPVRTVGGGVAHLRRSALLVPGCPHHLLSACNAAAEGVFSVHLGLGTDQS
jgi:hypothetical protein